MPEPEENKNENEDKKPSYEDLAAQLKESNDRNEKISSDYKSIEKQRNQLESGIRGITNQIHDNGLGRVNMDGANMSIEFANQQSKKEDKSEIDLLNEQKTELKRKYDNAEIEQEDYIDRVSEINGDISASKRMAQYTKTQEEKAQQREQKLTHDEWVNKAQTDYKDAFNASSPLRDKMSELAVEGVDYNKDASRFYELARAAKLSLGVGKEKGGNVDASMEFSSLKNSGGDYSNNQNESKDFYDNSEKTKIVQSFGKEGAARINRAINMSVKLGGIMEGDKNLTSSVVYLPIE